MEEVHVITSVERKRKYTADDKARLLAEAAELGATATARRRSISASLIYSWKKQAKRMESPFLAIAVKAPPPLPLRLCLGDDICLELPQDVEPKAIVALLKELRRDP